MALLPLYLDEILDASSPFAALRHPSVCKKASELQPSHSSNDGIIGIQNSKEGFKVNLDVQQFRPAELSVKMIDDFIVVEGKHEERQDAHGFISRHFQRRYKLPKDVDREAVSSALSSDGILTISAPKKKPLALPDVNERIVPMRRTSEFAVNNLEHQQQSLMA